MLQYENGKVIGELPITPSIFYFEYIDEEITAKEFISKYSSKMKSNCIADIVLFEIFQIQVQEEAYKLMLDMVNNNKEIVIREYFKENIFSKSHKVLQIGTYTYSQSNISGSNGLFCYLQDRG